MLEIVNFEEVTQIRMSPDRGGSLHYWVSAYLIDGLLIDTGSVYTATALAEYLSSNYVAKIVNTHYHEDHVGGNKLVKSCFDVPLYAHPVSISLMSQGHHVSAYRKSLWGEPPPTSPLPVPTLIKTLNHTFEVVDTPGHCPGHICLVEHEKGWVFSGDLYIGQRPKTASNETDLAQLIGSMIKVSQLPLKRLILFTSLRTIEAHGRDRLLKCVNWYHELGARAADMRSNGYTVDRIVEALFGGESVLEKITGGLYSSRRLVEMLLDYWAK